MPPAPAPAVSWTVGVCLVLAGLPVVVADLEGGIAHQAVVLDCFELGNEARVGVDEESNLGNIIGDGQDAVRTAIKVDRPTVAGQPWLGERFSE